MRRKSKRRRKHAYNKRRSHRKTRYNRRHKRRSRRNRGGRGAYARFVKAHKGMFKKHGFKAASRKIAAMWHKKH